MDVIQFTKTEKGRDKACCDGYFYNFEKNSKQDVELEFCVCEDYFKSLKCKGRIHIKNGRVVKNSSVHNHAPNWQRKSALDAVAQVKHLATTSSDGTDNIVTTATSDLQEAATTQLPAEYSLKRTVQRKRVALQNHPAEPKHLEDLVIPDAFKEFEDGTKFLVYDSGPGSNRICIFSTQANLELLSRSEQFFSDGTFSTAPRRLFYQLYSIHGIFHNNILPLVYAFLPNKSAETYGRLMEELKRLQPSINPQKWMTDFERASINAIQSSFPQVSHTGCFFHFQQCVWRKIQEMGLSLAYREQDGAFALSARCLAALAFVPLFDVCDSFDMLVADENFDQRLQPLVVYFEDTWIGRRSVRGQRDSPMFPITSWNVFTRCLNRERRTNNDIEGWHRRFQTVVIRRNPSVFDCIEALKREQKRNETRINRINAGEQLTHKKRKYRDLDERIFKLVTEYGERSRVQYLRGIAYNFQFKEM